MPRLALY